VTSEQWSRVASILDAALAQDPHGRDGFVDKACGGDAILREEVHALLAGAAAVDDFLSGAAADLTVRLPDENLAVGAHIGPYIVVSRIGGGGMDI